MEAILRYLILIIFAILLLFSPASSESVAILPFDAGAGLDTITANSITECVQYSFVQHHNRYSVLARKQIKKILHEQKLQLTGLTESAVEAGNILGVNYVITGNIMKLGDKYILIIQFIDVETGEILHSKKKSAKVSLDDIDILLVDPAVAKLFISDETEKENLKKRIESNFSGFVITILRGIKIQGFDIIGPCDPWVEIWLGNKYIGRTKFVRDNPSPNFNESFKIPEPNKNEYIRLIIYDHNPFDDQIVGSVNLTPKNNTPFIPFSKRRNSKNKYYKPESGQYPINATINGQLYTMGLIEIKVN